MSRYTGKVFSVLGDSISTFSLYTPQQSVFYSGHICREAGITDVRDTWWMRVIDSLGGTLGINDSRAGTTVSGDSALCGCSQERTSALGEPDVILVFMGLNDAAFCVGEEAFLHGYSLMLTRLKAEYPSAAIWCGTLPRADYAGTEPFFSAEAFLPLDAYNILIRRCACENGCFVADIAADGRLYDSIDGVHPDRAGMDLLAGLWLKALTADEPKETEHKYLIGYPDTALLDALCSERIEITQTYLRGTGGDFAARVRKSVYADGIVHYSKNEKRALTALTRIEYESEIDESEYTELLKSADPLLRPIEKTRWKIPHDGLILEIDVFPFWHKQAFCEVEIENEAQSVSLPDYIRLIREVSADKAYTNSALAAAIPAED